MRSFLLLASAATLLSAQVPTKAMTVEQVLAKHFEAEGGLARRLALQTLRMSGKMVGGEKDVEVIAENKRPNFLRVDVIVSKAVQTSAFDGKTGWRQDPFSGIGGGQAVSLLNELETAQVRLQADMDGPLVDWAAKGNKVEYLGIEKLASGPSHKLRLTQSSGTVSTLFFDATSFLKIRQTSMQGARGAEVDAETLYSDYRAVGGLKFPFVVEQGTVGDSKRQKFILEKVEVDAPIEASRFMMPMVFRLGAPKPPSVQ